MYPTAGDIYSKLTAAGQRISSQGHRTSKSASGYFAAPSGVVIGWGRRASNLRTLMSAGSAVIKGQIELNFTLRDEFHTLDLRFSINFFHKLGAPHGRRKE